MTDYRFYKMSREESLKFFISCSVMLSILGLLFYRSLLMAVLCSLASIPLKKYYAEFLRKKRLEKLEEAFKDVLYAISGSVAAGRQLPQAISEAAKGAASSYGRDSDIARELGYIASVYTESHGDAYSLLSDFGHRSGLEEIRQFAQSCSICRRCGGDMENVALKSAALLIDRMEIAGEVKALIKQKKTDIVMLTVMPIAVLAFLNLASFSYLEPLYKDLSGRLLMTLCLVSIVAALIWCIRITDIEL